MSERSIVATGVRTPRRLVFLAAALALQGPVLWLYLWFASGGFTFRGAGFGHYYDLLGDAFLAGQVHLLVMPSPELLAMPDPYDPAQIAGCRCYVHDLSFYQGRYYLYFGPVPGLLHAGWKTFTGLTAPDGAMQALFGLGGCLWFLLLARALRDRAFPRVPDGLVLLVYLCYALGGVGLHLQARPVVYHEAILAASFFTLGGCYFWLRGLAGCRSAGWHLAVAGFLFGCALGSRTTVLGYPLGAGLVLLWQCLRAHPPAPAIRRMLAFGLPLAAMMALLLLYNYARFGSFIEFGQRYQLNGIQGVMFDPRVAPYTLVEYVTFLPRFLPYYPFLVSEWDGGQAGAARWVLEPPLASVLILAPLTILAPLAIGLLTPRWRRADAAVRAFVVGMGLGLAGTLGTLSTFTWVAGRYMQDFLPITGLLGGLGLWWLYPKHQPDRPLRRLAVGALGAAILAISLAAGLSYGMSELSNAHPDADLRLAYRFDSAMAGLLGRLAPEAWPASYLTDEVRQRPSGIFYPEQSVLRLAVPPGTSLRSLEVTSLFPTVGRVRVEVDGQPVAEGTLMPGRQQVRFPDGPAAGPTGEVALRLRFPGASPHRPGYLWPVRVGPLSYDKR
jgi:hypothetical protein